MVLGCRPECGFPKEQSKQAPIHGAYYCDLPVYTFEKMIKFVNEEIKPDVVFWTGDAAPHDIWVNSFDHVKIYQKVIADYMKTNFSDYAIYPMEGNHDFGVANQ